MKNKKTKIGLLFASSLAFFAIGVSALVGISPKDAVEAKALTIPTNVNLKDSTESEIRAYYSYLENLPASERRGQNLLKNLKYILVNNPNTPSKPAQYFTYNQVRSIYRITDRNWYSSPASGISGYNSSTNKITGFNYSENPYLYYYYRDDNFTNPHTATAQVTSKEGSVQTLLNQEHIWSKSHGFSQDGGVPNAGSDLHHLVAADVAGNKWGHQEEPYGYVSAESSDWVKTRTNWDNGANAILNNKRGTALNASSQDTETTVFEPRDEDKGDFARAMFYMAARYNYIGESSFTASIQEPNLELVDYFNNDKQNCSSSVPKVTYGKLGDLLQFHKQDPVVTGSNKDFEVHRNNLIYNNYQYTRNPFIDFPEWVDYVWGDDTTKYAKPSTDTINGYNEGGGGDDPVAVTGVNVSPSTLSIETSATSQLTATVVPANATNKAVTWTSSNTSVATVSSYGLVTGIAEGTATITVTTSDGGYNASCVVTVSAQTGGTYSIKSTDTFEPAFPTNKDSINTSDTAHLDSTVNINIKEKGIYKYQSSLLFVSTASPFIYNTEPINNIKSVTVTYGSGCSASAKAGVTFGTTVQSTYTSEGNKTVAGAGSSDLWTCSQNNCGYFQLSTSTNNARISQIDIVWETGGSTDSVSLNKNSTTLDIGNTETLIATASGNVTWSSLDDEIASVDSNGTITAVGEGTTTITAICGTATANCIVTVNTPTPTDYVTLDKSSMTIAVGNTGTLTADASGSVTWSSSDTSIAAVDQTGEVTGIAEGIATITATCGTASATCTVTVSSSAPVISADGLYFRKITSTDELSDGKYIIATNVSGTYYALSTSFPTSASGGQIAGTTKTVSNNKIDATLSSGFVVEIANSSSVITISNGEKYLAYASSTNITSADSVSDKAQWTVSTPSIQGTFRFTNNNDTTRGLLFHGTKADQSATYNKFGCFKTSNVKSDNLEYTDIELFKEEQASKYAYKFMNAFTCDNGAHEPSFNNQEGTTTKWSWTLLKTYFTDDLDAEDKAALTGATANEFGNTIEQAVARYDKVVSHWKYENFMSRSITGLNNRTSFISSDNELFIVIISTSSIVSVTAIGLYMLLKRRKEQ